MGSFITAALTRYPIISSMRIVRACADMKAEAQVPNPTVMIGPSSPRSRASVRRPTSCFSASHSGAPKQGSHDSMQVSLSKGTSEKLPVSHWNCGPVKSNSAAASAWAVRRRQAAQKPRIWEERGERQVQVESAESKATCFIAWAKVSRRNVGAGAQALDVSCVRPGAELRVLLGGFMGN